MPASIFILLPLLLLFLSPVLIIVFRIWRPRLAYYWLTAAFTTLFAWVLILLARPGLPVDLTIGFWQPVEIFPLSPQLSIDPATWLFSLAAVTILLVVNITSISTIDPDKGNSPDWMSLAGSSGITGLSLLVMFSANLLTTVLTWALIDFVEFIIYLSLAKDRFESERVVVKFSLRAAGIVIGIYAGISGVVQGLPLSFGELSSFTSGLLILAVGTRIGLIPNTPILPQRLPSQTGYGALLRIITTAAHFPLLVKIAHSGAPPQMQAFLWIWTAATAFLSAISWLSAPDSRAGRHYLVIGISSLVVASAISQEPQAVIAFGWMLILPCSLVLISTYRNRWHTVLLFLAALTITGLPYSPTWHAVLLYSGNFHASWLLMLPAQSLILVGFLSHSINLNTQKKPAERWSQWLYAWGGAINILITYLLSWWLIDGSLGPYAQNPDLLSSWPSLAILGLIGLIWLIRQRIPERVKKLLSRLSATVSLGKTLTPVWRFFLWLRKLVLFGSQILESQSGILWALLILVLIISLFNQAS